MRPYWSRRVDPNQKAIVEALRLIGAVVVDLSSCGGGIPDLLVNWRGFTVLMEVKRPAGPRGGKSTKGQKLNALQERFRQKWTGNILVAHDPEEAINLLKNWTGDIKDNYLAEFSHRWSERKVTDGERTI